MTEITIDLDKIKYLDNFSKTYTPEELKLGTRLKNEINNKTNKHIKGEKNITPQIVKEYLRLFNSKKLDATIEKLLGESTIQSTPTTPTTTINTGTIQHVPRV